MPRTAAKSAVMKREPARRQPWSLGHTPDSENFVNIAVVKLKLVVSLFKLFILKLYFSFKKFYVIFLVCARRQTLTKTDSDQAAFSILATKLHRTEQSSMQKKNSCATVKRLRNSPYHTCDFVARDKVARQSGATKSQV